MTARPRTIAVSEHPGGSTLQDPAAAASGTPKELGVPREPDASLELGAPPEPVRWLGVDPGAVRVGIAACDPEERVAVPLEVVPASAAFPAIRAIALREGAGGIVVGLPRSLDGSEGVAAAAARKLGERLRGLGLPLAYEDERLSSVAAEREAPRGRPGRAAAALDDVAAALILQQFIDRRRRARGAAAPERGDDATA